MYAYVFFWACYTVYHIEIMFMVMTVHLKANYVLVPFHKSSIAPSKIALEVDWLYVTNNISNSPMIFNLFQLILKPFHMAT